MNDKPTCDECNSENLVHNEYTMCVSCGTNLGGEQYQGKHLRKQLRELVDEWRQQVNDAKKAGVSYEHWKAIEYKADELEKVLHE